MLELKYENLSLGFIGDIHGNFKYLQSMIKPFSDTIFIIAGDCGFGFPDTKEENISKMIEKIFRKFLEKRNLYLLFLRGNHDNPEMFNKDLFNDRFKLIPDYTYITLNNINILCIGGAISIDRSDRTINKSYWENESIDKIKEYPINVDILCTHTIYRDLIDHILPVSSSTLEHYLYVDKKLVLDLKRENKLCKKLWLYYNPKYWIHGHFHKSGRILVGNTNVISLNINEIYEYREI